MIERPLWVSRLQDAWRRAPIVWLSGVRRVGKTVLARSFPEAEFLNCDLPSVQEVLRDPESFYRGVSSNLVVLDEVHQLPDPSRLLKIAADAFPGLRLLATGSSTLAATTKFRDTLTGRKHSVHLVPVLHEELGAFGVTDLDLRLLRGGLPPALLAPERDPAFYAEWMDSYFARDIQELFRLGKRSAFLRFLELVLRQSGGLLEATTLAKHAGVSRPTVTAWMDVLQVTHAVTVLRPFSDGGRREIIAQPKVYGFDTGFVCHVRGWNSLRPDDRGSLWEHLVLETLQSIPQAKVHYWRDKQMREVDFVLPRGRGVVDAIECKWNADAFETRSLAAFRSSYPHGRNYLVCPGSSRRSTRRFGSLEVDILPLELARAEFAQS